MLDSRAPPGGKYSYQDQEAQAERQTEEEAGRLIAETRLWRLANSAQWVAWGIVQAHVPGLPDFDKEDAAEMSEKAAELESATKEMRIEADAEGKNDGSKEKGEEEEAKGADAEDASLSEEQNEEEEFDYLGYAQERAMFVWGDAIRLGIIKANELPEEVRNRAKIVEY